MKESKKIYGCLTVIGVLIIVYISLSLINGAMNLLEIILSNDIVNFSIPIIILIILYYSNENRKKDKNN